VLVLGAAAGVAAVVANSTDARAAADQAWGPFVLVVGLLLVGVAAHEDGLFDALAAVADRVPGSSTALLLVLLGVVAVVTALLNLDTSVAFLTPVLILAARRRAAPERAFIYGALFMSNSASLLLPGSNLTNLLVLAREHVSGALFAARMLPAWVAAVAVTSIVVLAIHRSGAATPVPAEAAPPPPRVGMAGLAATAAVAMLVLLLRQPALPVLVVGVAAVAVRRVSATHIAEAVGPGVLVGLFGLAVGLGALARSWDGPAHLIRTAGGWETAAIGAVAAVAVNNLPAAVLLTAHQPPHPRALLLGLNLGPNLAVTGSLSALLWYRAARRTGAEPSLATVTRIGVVLVPLSIVAAGYAIKAFAPQHL
jgi:arsenical pump membrane protein